MVLASVTRLSSYPHRKSCTVRFSSVWELVLLASELAASAASGETFEAADDKPRSGRLATITMSLCGSPTDLSGMGTVYLVGT